MPNREQELAKEIEKLNKAYFVDNQSLIADEDYDLLVEELKSINPNNSVLTGVGHTPSYGKKIKHPFLMGSLSKVYSFAELEQWANKYLGQTLILQPKIDGCAIRLRYVNSRLVEAVTRGNGEVGQDVKDNIKAIKSIPNTLNGDFTGHITGEIYMSHKSFEAMQASDTDRQWANPRNAASGSLCQKDPGKTGKRNLELFVYNLMEDGVEFNTEKEKTERTKEIGLTYVNTVETYLAQLFSLIEVGEKNRYDFNYDIDGLVISLSSAKKIEDLGNTGRCPKGRIAYKFKAEKKASTLTGIHWQVGRTGKVTPVGEIEPIQLCGTTISQVTLHNAGRVFELGLRIGDEVTIQKSGEIIPHVVSVVNKEDKKAEIPEHCPCCGSLLTALTNDNCEIHCQSLTCPEILENSILYYLRTLEIKGIGPGIVRVLIIHFNVKSPADLYYLDINELQEHFGDRQGEIIYEAVFSKHEVDEITLLTSLGIPNIGKTVSRTLIRAYGDLGRVCEFSAAPRYLNGIGKAICKNLFDAIHPSQVDSHYRKMLMSLQEVLEVQKNISSGKLMGKVFCITGTLGKPRKQIIKEIEDMGGEVSGSVSKKVHYLVNNDVDSSSSKNKKAKQLNIPIINESSLYDLANNSPSAFS